MNYDFSPIAKYMEDVTCGKKNVPGCDILVKREHETLYRHICGYSDAEAKTALADSQLYFMYSCTKPLTVTTGMRLVEEGKLDLDAPVGDYLPSFRDVFLLKDGVRVKPQHPPTVRNLFTMTAGLDYTLHTEFTDAVNKAAGGNATTRAIIDVLPLRPLCFEPGDHFQYSLCHDVLAAVAEEVAQTRFAEYMREIIFEPLGMADSTFDGGDKAVLDRVASQYRWDGERRAVVKTDKSNCHRITGKFESGGAGLISSTEDYSKFADTMACEGRAADGYRLLKPETVKLMRTEQLHSFIMNNNFSCAAGPGYGYGLGVRTRIDQNEGQRSPIGEFGWDGAAGAYVMMDPVNHLSITFAMHVLNWPGCIGPDHAILRDMIYDIIELKSLLSNTGSVMPRGSVGS